MTDNIYELAADLGLLTAILEDHGSENPELISDAVLLLEKMIPAQKGTDVSPEMCIQYLKKKYLTN